MITNAMFKGTQPTYFTTGFPWVIQYTAYTAPWVATGKMTGTMTNKDADGTMTAMWPKMTFTT